MFKTMILMTRNPAMRQEKFIDWWTTRHNQLALALPQIRKIVFNVVADGEISGIAELWFDTKEDFGAALGSEAGQAALADVQAMVSYLQQLHVDEHELLPKTR